MPSTAYYAWRSYYAEMPKETAAIVGAIVGSTIGALFMCVCACCAFGLWWRVHGARRLRVFERERRNVKIVTAPLNSTGSRRNGMLQRHMERTRSTREVVMDPEL